MKDEKDLRKDRTDSGGGRLGGRHQRGNNSTGGTANHSVKRQGKGSRPGPAGEKGQGHEGGSEK